MSWSWSWRWWCSWCSAPRRSRRPPAVRQGDELLRQGRRTHALAEPDLPSADLPPPIPATVEFARQVKANEAGLVPVLMYHRIVKKRLASIDRTPSQLRQELEKLAKNDYVPITAQEFVTGNIDIPAGKHPVVLTFDDGHSGHFALDADGMPAKDTAVGIIYQVARKYPGFRPVATFWVTAGRSAWRTWATRSAPCGG